MKKLIAMIGAVATAFGLFADAKPFATSFEEADGVTEATYTPGDGWTWQGDPLTVGVYAGDKYAGYAEEGALARRSDKFLDVANNNYLKLETGTNALTRAVGGNDFLDQLVKFTGFEEYQTNVVAGTKIAVWMSGIEQEGTATWVPEVPAKEAETNELGEIISPATEAIPAHYDYSDDYIASETNLYVTVGKIDDDGNITPVKIKIDGEYKLDTWYRLTIKSLGSIFQFSNHAGFIIYVDGQQVSSSDPDATLLVANAGELSAVAKGYMAEGQLFPAIDNSDATFATVGYQGIGAIDDIILDKDGPEFARTVEVTADELYISGAKIVKVEQAGEVVTGDGTWTVKPGDIVVWYAPDGAFIVKGAGKATWKYNDGAWEQDADDSDIEVVEAAAVLNETEYKAEDELYDLLVTTGLENGDSLEFLAGVAVKESDEADSIYEFSEGTKIDVSIENDEITWMIESVATGDLVIDNAGAAAGFAKYYTLADESSMVCLAGKVAGLVQADYLDVSSGVTISGTGKVMTLDGTLEILGDDSELIEPTYDDESGYYVYALATEPETTGFAIIIADKDPVYYPTLQEAINNYEGEGAVTIMDNVTVDATTVIVNPVTIDLNEFTLTFAADLATGIQATEAGTVTISNGKIASAAGRGNIAGSKAIYFLRTSAVLTDVEIDVPGFDYALTHMGNIGDLGQDKKNYWAAFAPYTLDCNNVDVKGNGSLFHLEYVKADLDADCSAIQSAAAFGASHQAAIYSSCGAVVTVNGGTYTAVNALQTGNMGGDIIVKGGEFNGNIMSFMYKGDERYEGNAACISIAGGQFDGNFAFAANQPAECTKDEVTWDITGGSFSADPSAYLAAGYAAIYDDVKWYSVAQSADPVATVTLEGGQPVEYTDLHKALVDGSVAGAVVELIDNVDLAGKNWEPVNDFYGKFDGKGFIISNLTIAVESGNNLGLFGSWTWAFDHAGICNFTIENVSITAPSSQNVGAVAGKNGSDDGIAISNVTVCGSIQINAAKYVGGICGHNAYNKIIDCHVSGTEGSFIGNASGSQIGGIAGSSGEGTMLIANSSVSGVKIIASMQAGGIQGRLFYGNRVIGCSTEDVTLDVAGTTAGLIVGQIQLNGSAGEIHYVLNCTTDDEINPLVGSDTDYPIVRTVIGTGFEGDFGSFTAGTFTADAAALAALTAEVAAGYEPVANEDGTYTITQVFPIEVVNAGDKATVTIDQTGSVIPGAKITGTVSDVAEGFKAFVFVDGVKATVDNEGKFEGTATASAKITVAYAKDSAWYLDPFVKNEFAYGCQYADALGEVAIDEADYNLYFTPNRHQFVNANTGVFQFRAEQFAATFGHEWAPVIAGTRTYKTTDGMNGQENFRRLIPSYALDLLFVGKGWGDRSDNRDFTSIYPADGNWGDPNFGGTAAGAEQYLLGQSDIGNKLHQWQRVDPGVVSTDGKYMYATVYPKEQICKVDIITNENGKVTLFRPTGTDVTSVEAPTAATSLNGIRWMLAAGDVPQAITIYNVNGQDVVLAATGNGKIIRLDNSGDTTLGDGDNGERGYTVLGNVGPSFRTISVTGKEDGTPHLVCQGNNTETYVYALAVDGNGVVTLVSASPIAQFSAKTSIGLANEFWSLVAEDSETYAFANYRSATEKFMSADAAMAVVLEKKPANLIVRGQFVTDKTVEQPADIMPEFGAQVEQIYTAPAGYQIDSVTVNGKAVDGFVAGSSFTFSSTELNEYTLVKMTISKTPFIILISSDGTEKARYADLNEAFAAAAEGDTVKLLQDGVAGIAATNNVAMTFDLGGFELTRADGATGPMITANETLVITNGSINGGGVRAIDILADGDVTLDYIEVTGTVNGFIQADYGALTIGSNAVITANCDLMYAGDSIVNIYGTLTRGSGERPLMWAYGDTGVLNIYDGAVITSHGADVIRSNGGAQIVNVYGGELTSGGYPVFYSYNSATTVYNIYGGKLKSTDGGIFQIAGNKLATITPFGADCKAQFNTLRKGWNEYDLDHYLAEGYAFVKEGDWYVVKQTYTVTLKNGDVVVDTQVVADGLFATNVVLDVEGFKGWTNDTYTAAFEFATTAITADITLFAWIEAAGPVIPVDDEKSLDDNGKAAAAEVAEVFGDDLATWVAKVYGDGGKIPASKLNGTTSDLIAIAQAYDLPIMTDPEVEIEKAAEGDGFTFQIVDDGTPVAMQAAKVLSMVQFTADLGVAFDAATTDNVEVALSTDSKTATATFKKATNAGFMKVKLATPTK